jgi:hypothetical protein
MHACAHQLRHVLAQLDVDAAIREAELLQSVGRARMRGAQRRLALRAAEPP